MSCEPIGVITVKRYLQEKLPEDVQVFIECGRYLEKVQHILCWDGELTAILTDRMFNHQVPVTVETPLYIAFSDLRGPALWRVRKQARAASAIPILAPVGIVESNESVPAGNWLG
jgi:hypothetical protein